MRKKLFFILALLCAVVQGAWAQASWDEVYAMTNTTSANWTALTEGSTTGKTIGTAGTTTYYYADANLSFTNSTAGGSALTILGNVYLYLPQGVTVTCTGANASGQTGAGAGIELTESNTLWIIGKGTVNATGGNAADGCNGANGANASYSSAEGAAWVGGGGTGGNGGGGAGAGIGTRGGDGGAGGSAAESEIYYQTWVENGVAGSAGGDGQTAGAMGTLYASDGITVNAMGGSYGAAGTAGSAGKSYLYVGYNVYSFPGGGGGGAGGFGGAASNIGTGGPGGGGGGGGAKGSHTWAAAGFFQVFANGGGGGQNGDGSFAAAGGTAGVSKDNVANGLCDTNDAQWVATAIERTGGDVTTTINGGSSGAAGSASISEQADTFNLKMPAQGEWDMVCQQTKTSQSQWRMLLPGSHKGATIGTADATTYYFAMGDCTFTNANAGGSGLTILGTVHLFIASGQTITCTGTDADGATGAGAGVELAADNTLCLIGGGKIVATGGQAANGCNGFKGGDAAYKIAKDIYDSNGIKSGDGGRGGDGGGGAGAGIGTRGADGGAGGAGGVGKQEFAEVTGNVGSNGVGGGTAADMGTLYVYQMATPTIEAHGGSSGTSGSGGAAGLNAVFRPFAQSSVIIFIPAPRKEIHDGSSGTSSSGAPRRSGDYARGEIYSIGGGGPGGGGGGGGASGSITYKDHLTGLSYYQVGAFGGKGGANADGTAAADGEETMINSEKTNVIFDEESYKDYTFLGWYNGDNRAAGGAGANPGAAAQSGTYEVIPAIINLADNADNSTTISDAHGYLADVTLSGRTLYKDGKWNTLCLPFDVTIAGSPLAGATARPLTSASISGTKLHLTFGGEVTTLVAGTPYIIKWASGDDIVSPVFSGVTIDADADGNYDTETASPAVTTDERVRFLGTYKSTTFDAEDKSILLMGGGNTLYYPATGAGIGAQRAYFKIGEDGAAAPRLTRFSIDFGEGDNATGIINVSAEARNNADGWYSLDGRKLVGKPRQNGIYINNGKKVVIK